MSSMATFGSPGGEIDTEFPARLAAKDTKTAVNEFCQRFCHRPVTKEDIQYVVQKYPGGFQATVKLNCIEGKEFAGELAPTQKEAEKSAGQQVLDFYAEQINNMPKLTGKKKKSSGSGLGDPAAKVARIGEPAVVGALSPKSELNSTCSKIMRCVMEKGHVVYEAYQVGMAPDPQSLRLLFSEGTLPQSPIRPSGGSTMQVSAKGRRSRQMYTR
ncbi:unnamed protein product [Prorocentrum cordatum]|uniref:DRBM domain-containing protein n=1 Tax=Prorocentrum cordatum TaxID=2364126 RepID=A0ABN9QCX2_9DINO|nr:unnamed protein product [Polarella glacialis]